MVAGVVAPTRTPEQREVALQRANMIRSWRAGEKRTLTRDRAVELIADPPELAESWKLSDLLVHIPRMGKATRDRMLKRAGIAHVTTLRGLTPRQREAITAFLQR